MGDPRVKVTKPDWLVAQEEGRPYTFKRAAPRKNTDPGITTGYSARMAGREPAIDHGPDPHKGQAAVDRRAEAMNRAEAANAAYLERAQAARLLLESS